MKRVVVTGMAGITSLGETSDEIFLNLMQRKVVSAICQNGNSMLTFGLS